MNQYFTNNNNLKSERRIIKYEYDSSCYEFISDNGVFSKDRIDFGSRLLVDTYLKSKKNINNFLDVGCGYGFISILLAHKLNITGIGIDVNLRALKLAHENAKLNNVSVSFKESNIYENVEGKFDLIISNPPIRAGKQVVLEILLDAQYYLSDKGELWFVIRRDGGALSIKKEIENYYDVEIKEKSKGFYIFIAKKN